VYIVSYDGKFSIHLMDILEELKELKLNAVTTTEVTQHQVK
jgi:hypothetical protein